MGPKINFIVGKNGSGKSTILTALSTCLGGRASNTQRASSLKELIKEGKDSALVRVVFANIEGSSGFKRDVYGDEITVERRIDKVGAGNYKIRGADGKVFSSTKAELTNMLESFGIHVDNPFAILTQDTARSFLTSSSGEEKYRFLEKAMLADKIEIIHEATEEKLKSVASSLAQQKATYMKFVKEVEEFEAKYKAQQRLKTYGKERTTLEAIKAWHKVTGAEKIKAEREDTILTVQKEIQEIQSQVDNEEEGKADIIEQINKVDYAIDQKSQSVQPLIAEKDSLVTQKNAIKAGIVELRQNEKGIKESIAESRKERQVIQDDINKLIDKSENGGMDDERTQLETRRVEIAERIKIIKREYDDCESQKESVAGKINKLYTTDDNLRKHLSELQSQSRNSENHLGELQQAAKEHRRAFGNNIDSLLRDIGNARFKEPPIGPVGLHVRLKKPEWSSILETVFRNVLNSFIVFDFQDQALLLNIFKKHNARFPIFVRKRDLFSYEHNMPDTQKFETILDALDVPNEDVKRLLIDIGKIERRILIADRKAADFEMHRRPRNVEDCFAMSDKNPREGFQVGNRAQGASGSAPVYAWEGAPRMRTDVSSTIRDIRQEIEKIEIEIRRFKDKLEDIKRSRKDLDAEIKVIERKQTQLKIEQQKLEVEAQALDEQLESLQESNHSTRIDELKGALTVSDSEIEKYEDQLVSVYAEMEEKQAQIREFEQQIGAKTAEIKQVEIETRGLQKEKEKFEKELQELDRLKDKIGPEIDKRRRKITEFRAKIEKDEENLKRAIEAAERKSIDRLELPEGKTIKDINEGLEKIQASINAHESDGLEEDIAQKYRMAVEKKAKALAEFQPMVDLFKKVKKARPDRIRQFEKIKQNYISRMKNHFKKTVASRGHLGQLSVDDANKRLTLLVSPANRGTKDLEHEDADKLSGGEKSFSQIALLTAIWQTVENNLLALDEL